VEGKGRRGKRRGCVRAKRMREREREREKEDEERALVSSGGRGRVLVEVALGRLDNNRSTGATAIVCRQPSR